MANKAVLGAVIVASLLAGGAQAATITQWNFNSIVPDANTGTGTTTAAIGAGLAGPAGGTTTAFASGDANGGSTDPFVGDDSGWNLTTFAAQGAGNKTRGAQFSASTAGFTNIILSYDIRHSNTSSRYEQVQYSTDGTNFVDIGPLFDGNAGDTWFNSRTINLTGIAGVDNNASFAFRVVAAQAPTSGTYLPSNATSTYGTSGTWRFDMVTVSGTAVVPVPAALPLALSALGALAAFARRRAVPVA